MNWARRVVILLLTIAMAATMIFLGVALASTPPEYTAITLDNPSPQDFGLFGGSVAAAADINGDGTPDLLVGAPGHEAGGNIQQGQAFVFSGATGGVLLTLDNPSPQANAFFGDCVAAAPDIDGDGIPDLLIGAPWQDVGGNDGQGQAFVFSGATGGLLLTLDNPSPQDSAGFGRSTAITADLDGDNMSDLLIGAYAQDVSGTPTQGQAFVFSGATGGLVLTLDTPSTQVNAHFGISVAGVEDLDGDDTAELLVGAHGQDVGGNDGQGQAFVFSGATGGVLLTLDNPSPQANAFFGDCVAAAPDIDGDGIPDLLIGAPWQDVGGNDGQGQALVFSGATGGLLLTLDNPSPQEFGLFGGSVAAAVDVNGDGTPDLLVGAPGIGGPLGEEEVPGQAFLFLSVPPPPPVGGTIVPTDKSGLVMPWVIAVGLIVAAGVSLAVWNRRRGTERASD